MRASSIKAGRETTASAHEYKLRSPSSESCLRVSCVRCWLPASAKSAQLCRRGWTAAVGGPDKSYFDSHATKGKGEEEEGAKGKNKANSQVMNVTMVAVWVQEYPHIQWGTLQYMFSSLSSFWSILKYTSGFFYNFNIEGSFFRLPFEVFLVFCFDCSYYSN